MVVGGGWGKGLSVQWFVRVGDGEAIVSGAGGGQFGGPC